MTDKDELRAIAKKVADVCGEGVGYALFLATGPEVSYISNADRADVISSLEEWLGKVSPASITLDLADKGRIGRSFTTTSRKETSHQIDTRLTLERRCADIGKTIGQVTKLCLFLFNFGEGGNMAYFTNMEDARKGVASWVKSQRAKS
jgi:hypothetical protein